MTLNNVNSIQGQAKSTPAYNTAEAKASIQYSSTTFTQSFIVFIGVREQFGAVVNQPLVLRINPNSYRDGENRTFAKPDNIITKAITTHTTHNLKWLRQ